LDLRLLLFGRLFEYPARVIAKQSTKVKSADTIADALGPDRPGNRRFVAYRDPSRYREVWGPSNFLRLALMKNIACFSGDLTCSIAGS